MLSVVVLAKNEEKNIGKLIASLSLADEILVIDDYSDDQTVVVAQQFEAKVYKCSLNNDFAAQRNFGLAKVNGDWILFLDADEEISKALMNEIIQLINNPLLKTEGYYLHRQDRLWDKMMTGTEAGRVKLLRLIKKGKGKWTRRVHEYITPPVNTGLLKNPLIHNPHPTLREFIKDINYYSSIHAEENYKEHKRSSLFKIVFYPILKFLKNLIVLGGCKDGSRGFIVSIMMSLHSFLSWSKLWLIQ